MDYYASYKNSKDPSLLRKELVSYALKYGNKKAAQLIADNREYITYTGMLSEPKQVCLILSSMTLTVQSEQQCKRSDF